MSGFSLSGTTPHGSYWIDAGSAERAEVVCFIQAGFKHCYQAKIEQVMTRLLLQRRGAELNAVVGVRSLDEPGGMVQRYFDRPLEELIGEVAGESVGREEILEVGHLAAASRGAARRIIRALTHSLHTEGVGWVAFTAVPILSNTFRRMNVPLLDLGPADPARVGADAAAWGDYYKHQPRVMVVSVQQAGRAVFGDPQGSGAALRLA
ncbi:MAG: thermostable hemolysin [Gammaproteobacteria bacterium]|nr:thermostable hemolysin [Gammaproteobacteria bacterium]